MPQQHTASAAANQSPQNGTTLQHSAPHCNTPRQHTAGVAVTQIPENGISLQHIATNLKYTATHLSSKLQVLQ